MQTLEQQVLRQKETPMRRIVILCGAATLVLAAAVPALAAGPDGHGRPDNPGGDRGVSETPGGDRGVSADAPADKVDVCHYSADDDGFHLISISGNALEVHIENHGDVMPGDSVPDMENYEYGADCEIRSTQVVDGSFTDATLEVRFTAYLSYDDEISGTGYYSFTSNDGAMIVTDYCLDEGTKVASVWGPGASSADITGDGTGFWVLTLIDDGGGAMSTRALYFDGDVATAEADAETAFGIQCTDQDSGRTGGTGSLTFGPN
jgi:hypothetical protein